MRGPYKQGEDVAYGIRKYNSKKGDPGKYIVIVRGRSTAEEAVDYYKEKMPPEEKAGGWTIILERTTRKPTANARRG
jgi:hypothetical protein